MKRILIINNLLFGGGVEKILLDLTNNLSEEKYEITVFTDNYQEGFEEKFKKSIKYEYIFKEKKYENNNLLLRIIRKIKRKIDYYSKIHKFSKENYDVVIALKEGESMIFASKIKCKKKIAWIHTDYNVFYWTKYAFKNQDNELKCMKKFDKVVCVSKATCDSVKNVLGDSGNFEVIYNSLNVNEILQRSNEEEITFNRDNGEVIFITVGRLAKQKGYDRLLEACINLNKEGYKFKVYVIGDGDEKDNLQNIIDTNDIKNVELLGAKDNPYIYMKKADWFICSSTWESFGIAIQESIVLGVPVITTYCEGACEVIDKNQGLIVDNSVNGIYLGMKKVLDNKDINKIMKENIL